MCKGDEGGRRTGDDDRDRKRTKAGVVAIDEWMTGLSINSYALYRQATDLAATIEIDRSCPSIPGYLPPPRLLRVDRRLSCCEQRVVPGAPPASTNSMKLRWRAAAIPPSGLPHDC